MATLKYLLDNTTITSFEVWNEVDLIRCVCWKCEEAIRGSDEVTRDQDDNRGKRSLVGEREKRRNVVLLN